MWFHTTNHTYNDFFSSIHHYNYLHMARMIWKSTSPCSYKRNIFVAYSVWKTFALLLGNFFHRLQREEKSIIWQNKKTLSNINQFTADSFHGLSKTRFMNRWIIGVLLYVATKRNIDIIVSELIYTTQG